MEKLNPNGNILIFTPTLGLDPDPLKYQSSLLKVLNQIQALKMGLAYLPAYRQPWWPGNNLAWDVAFQNGFEYILRIDDDIHAIPDDAVEKLVRADKDVIGAAYPNRRWPFFPAAMNRTKQKSLIDICLENDRCLQYVQGLEKGEVVECELVGFGMTLIKTEPFFGLERPMYRGPENVPDDTYFAQVCLDHGIKQYVHFGVQVAHAHVDFSNNGYLFNAGLNERLSKHRLEQGKDIKISPEEMQELMRLAIEDSKNVSVADSK